MSAEILGTCSQVLKLFSTKCTEDEANRTNKDNDESSKKCESGEETNKRVNIYPPDLACRLPILANALTVPPSFTPGIPGNRSTEIFFMAPDGSLKRKFVHDQFDSEEPNSKRNTLMPGTNISYKTPNQSITNKSGKIKRPMNAFMIWARTARAKLAKDTPSASNAEISVRLGEVWSSLSKAEKQKYYMEAERVKAKHRQDYPDWIYQPEITKKKDDSVINHRKMFSSYNENRPVPKIVPKVVTNTQQGPFIKFTGFTQGNRPILTRSNYPLQPVTIMPTGNHPGFHTGGIRVIHQPQHPMFNPTFIPRTMVNGNYVQPLAPYHHDIRLQQPSGTKDFHTVQNVTIIHQNPPPIVQTQKGRPNSVSEKVDISKAGKTESKSSEKKPQSEDQTETAPDSQSEPEKSDEAEESSQETEDKKQTETPKKKTKKATNNKKGSSKKKAKADDKKSKKPNSQDIPVDEDSDISTTTLPGSTTQPSEEHPEDFWPFPFPPAEQESQMDEMFEGQINEPDDDQDHYNPYLCHMKSKTDNEKLNVDVSSWQQYLQHKAAEQGEKLDTYFVEEKAEIVNCPSDLDICPVPVALTLSRQNDNSEENSCFGSSISSAMNVLGGADEEDEDSRDEGSVIQVHSDEILTRESIIAASMAVRTETDNNHMVKDVFEPQGHYSEIGQIEVDTRPIKKRAYRYIQDLEDNLMIVE